MIVQNFVEHVWTVFEKFEIFMKRSGETKQKNDCISSRNFFPTLKKLVAVILKFSEVRAFLYSFQVRLSSIDLKRLLKGMYNYNEY